MGKITITFKIHEKQYSCEGLPENRERHFFDLMIHRSFAEGEIPSIYRSNFPEKAALSDVEILESYNQRRLRRERTLHSMKGSTTVSSANTTAINVFASPLGLNPDDSSSQTPFIASTPSPTEKGSPVQNPLRVRIPSQSMICHSGPSSFRLTPTQQSNYTRDEMQELNQFIDDVLSGPQKEASVETPKGATKKTSNLGRLRIFLQQDGADSQKMIQVKPGSSYNDVYEMARAKMGFPVALSFVDSDGMRIDIDDDDSFEMFLAREENKKMLLRVQEVEDLRNSPGSNPSLQHCVSMGSGVFSYSESRSTMVALETPVALSTHTFIGHNAAVYGCAFSPDGTTVVSASRDRTLRIWSVERGITLQTIKAHNGFVLSCDYSPRGTHVASSSDDQQIRLFSVSGKKNYTIKEHTDKVYGICFAPHGDIMMSCSCDATVRVWNVETGSRLASIKPHEKPIFRIGLSRTDNARYAVTSSDDQTSALVHWKDGRVVRKLVGHKGTVWSSAFSSDDRYVVTSSMDHSIKVWDTGSGQEICTLLGHNTPVHRAMFADVSSIAESSPGISSNEIIISCAKDRTISAWDVNSATLIYAHSGHHHTVYDLAQSGRNLVSASFDCTLRLWNTKDVICPGL